MDTSIAYNTTDCATEIDVLPGLGQAYLIKRKAPSFGVHAFLYSLRADLLQLLLKVYIILVGKQGCNLRPFINVIIVNVHLCLIKICNNVLYRVKALLDVLCQDCGVFIHTIKYWMQHHVIIKFSQKIVLVQNVPVESVKP